MLLMRVSNQRSLWLLLFQKCGVFLMPPKGGHAEADKNKHIVCVPCKDRKSSQHALIMD